MSLCALATPTIPAELASSGLDAAPDAMIFIDAGGTIQFANRQVSALFGYPPDEVIGCSVEMLMPARFRVQHRRHIEGYTRQVRVRNGSRIGPSWTTTDGIERRPKPHLINSTS